MRSVTAKERPNLGEIEDSQHCREESWIRQDCIVLKVKGPSPVPAKILASKFLLNRTCSKLSCPNRPPLRAIKLPQLPVHLFVRDVFAPKRAQVWAKV